MYGRSLKNLLSLLVGLSWLAQSIMLAHPVAALTFSHPSIQAYSCDESPLIFNGSNQGWLAENYSSAYAKVDILGQGIAPMSPVGIQKSTPLKLDLGQGHDSAQFSIDLSSVLPRCAQDLPTDKPKWQLGSILSLWVLAPRGTRGDPDNPNGLHLYAVDEKGKMLYGTWQTFQENTWFEVTLRLGGGNPACGSLDPEFDFSHIQKIGINVALNIKNDKVFAIKNNIYISPMRIKSGVFMLPSSDHLYSFEDATKKELPAWRIVTDKAWQAEAFTNAEIHEGALVIDADFRENNSDVTHRKGVMNLVFSPDLNLGSSDYLDDFFSLDIKFDPPPDFSKPHDCPLTLKLWAFDSGKKIQFDSINQDVGSGEWSRVAFRLGDLIPSTKGANLADRLDTSRIGKIGFQVYDGTDNYDYQGKIWIDNIAIGSDLPLQSPSSLSFVKTDGSHFILNDQRFRFVGANAEYLPYKPDSVVDDVLDRADSMGIRVIRTWGFGEGCEDYNLEFCEDVSSYFQPLAEVYNESAFEHFDRIVYEAGKRNIRLIVPLVNNWYEHGGIPRYVCWLKQLGDPSDCNVRLMSDEMHDTFYTDPTLRKWYQDYVKYFVTHVNTITGIPYADDPTIMAWELINEPRARSDPSGGTLHKWIVDMSAYLANYAPNQLIGTGEEGWYIMPKSQADQSKDWQVFDKNYWQYGVNWADNSCIDSWGSNGTDFLSDNSSASRKVEWQKRVGTELSSPVESEQRDGVPGIDFTGIHLYLSPSETGLSYAPYCYYYGLGSLCSSPYDTTNNSNFSGPAHQAKEWIDQHVKASHNELAKPFLLEEFNFPVASKIPLGVQTNPAGDGFLVTPDERARLFRQYLDLAYDLDVDGVMFWNLGYDGFMQQPWNEIDALKKWTADFGGYISSDDSSGIRFNYYPNQNNSMELSEPNVDWLRAEGNQVMVDLFNYGDAQEMVFEVQLSGEIMPRSKTIQIKPGENKFLLDELFAPVQKLQSKIACPLPKEEPPLVTRINITVKNFASAGSALFNFYSIFNNKYVIYPDDPVEEVIRTETTRWAQDSTVVQPKVKITSCNTSIHIKQVNDGVLPIQFNFIGNIEHADGYYYRYSIDAPKGQSELNFGSNGLKPTGQILVHANAVGKYEVKIAPEGESFDSDSADSCYFEVVNTPAFNIEGLRIDNQKVQPAEGRHKPDLSLTKWKREIRVEISNKEDVSAKYWVSCQLLKGNTVVNQQLFSCQQTLIENSIAKGLSNSIDGYLPPGQYELQLWSVDEESVKSEPARIDFEIPIPLDIYIIPGLILLMGFLGWRARTHRKSREKILEEQGVEV